MKDDVMAKRALCALAVVAALVLAVPTVDLAVGHAIPQPAAAGGDAGIASADIVGADGLLDTLQRLEGCTDGSGRDIPAFFSEEVGLLAGCRDVRADASGTVVGYIVDGDAQATFCALEDHMAERGWSEVPIGAGRGATFVKDGGACTWALATCTAAGDATSVVFRCVVA